MKAIFLDIDGVLCTPLSFQVNRLLRLPMERQRFDPLALFWLGWLLRRTGAELVLSSSWRDGLMADDPFSRAIMSNLFTRLEQNGTPLSDVTPLVPGGDKSMEIAAWLGCHPCERYVILDDNDCFSLCPAVREHWVHIPNSGGLRHGETYAAWRVLVPS